MRHNTEILFTPSAEQQLIIDAIKRGENVLVDAVAGSGKTTTILGIASQIPNKHILQVTYNRALKLEVERKVKTHKIRNLKILTYHGLACSFYDYKAYTDDRIQHIIKYNTPLNKPTSNIPYEIIIIDEIQDMTPLYFELIHKFIYNLGRHVILGIMGDKFQGIYGFKSADERFLTLGDKIFINHMNFTRLSLNTSYRLTQQMADFVNNVMIGGLPRIRTVKHGVPIKYIQYPQNELAEYMCAFIINEMHVHSYKAEDIFILSASLKNQNIKDLENLLVSRGILCFAPITEEAKLDEKIIKDKIVFSTIHQSKGRERKLCILYGFDTSYYNLFARDKNASVLICPNLLYVATTRASHQLIVIEHIDKYQSLPFLKMSHSNMNLQPYIKIHRHHTLETNENINSNKIYSLPTNNKPIIKSVTDLIKFINESTMNILTDLVTRIFTHVQEIKESNIVQIPADIQTSNTTHEQVSDINGVAIPAMLFSSKENYLWRYILKNYCIMSNQGKNNAFIMQYINKLKDKKRIEGIPDWLLIANIFLCAQDGFNYKLKQITNYDWLNVENVKKCHRNIDTFIDMNKICNFEFVLGTDTHSQKNDNCFMYNSALYGDVCLFGRVDCVTNDTVWELKCVDQISTEHMLQVVLYAWMWQQIYDKNYALYNELCLKLRPHVNNPKYMYILANLMSSDNLDSLDSDRILENADSKIVEKNIKLLKEYKDILDVYHSKKFKLLNIRTGECLELDITKTREINEIVEIIFDAKLRIREILTDEQFIVQQREQINKYKLDISRNDYLDDDLDDDLDHTILDM